MPPSRRISATPRQIRHLRAIRDAWTRFHCFPRRLRYRDATVYSCDIAYTGGAATDLCAVKIERNVITQRKIVRFPVLRTLSQVTSEPALDTREVDSCSVRALAFSG